MTIFSPALIHFSSQLKAGPLWATQPPPHSPQRLQVNGVISWPIALSGWVKLNPPPPSQRLDPILPTPSEVHLSLSTSLPLLLSNHNPLAAPLKFFCPIWEECYPRGKTEWSHNGAFSTGARLLLLGVAESPPPPSTVLCWLTETFRFAWANSEINPGL